MERKVNKLDKCHIEVVVTPAAEEWKAAQDKAFKAEASKIKVDGFRPGKAPLAMVKNRVNQAAVLEKAANAILQDAFKDVLNNEKINPVTQPKADITKLSPDEIEMKFTFATEPEIKLGQYKGLKVGKEKVEVTDKEVEDAVNAVLKDNATLVVKDDKAELGDTVVIDFVGTIDGVPFDGGSAENHELELGSNQFIPGFEAQLVGAKAGEHVDVKVKFPENYVENLKDKDAVFGVDVHEVKAKKLPELNDEFVKELGIPQVETIEALKENKKAELENRKASQAKGNYLNKLLDEIAKNSEVAIPDELIDNQAESHKKDVVKNMEQSGLTLEQYLQVLGQTEEQFMDSLKERSKKEVTNFFLLNEVIKAENLELTNEEIEFEIAKLAEQYKMSIDDVKKALEHQMDQFVNNMRMNRVEDLLFNEND